MNYNLSKTANFVIVAAGITAALVVAKKFLIPLALGIVLWYLIISLANTIKKAGSKFPHWLAISLSLLVVGGFLTLFGFIINSNVNEIIKVGPEYQKKITQMIYSFYEFFGAEPSQATRNLLSKLNIGGFLGGLTGALTSIIGNFGLILVYTIFLLLEYRTFDDKLHAFVSSNKKFKSVMTTIEKIRKDVGTYAKVKVVSSIFTGAIAYAILKAIGVDFAAFWGLIVFVLNFIPTIGSAIAVALASIQALVQFDTTGPFVLTLVLLLILQVTVDNFIQPRVLGKTLNLSPLAIILSLTFWGMIWGFIGMILSIPLTVIINIILGKFEKTKPITILFSGNVKNKI